jgi:hypothetical protein
MQVHCRMFISIVALMLLSACGTTYHIVPETAGLQSGNFSLTGNIDYEGNTAYRPRTVRQGHDDSNAPVIRYKYHVGYGKESVPAAFPLFNPFTLVGFPIGEDSLVVVGSLEVIKDGELLKQYSATCVIDKTRSLFYEGDTSSELRKKGLLMVRENIERQMSNDRELLSKF